jgi:hypothetical protein
MTATLTTLDEPARPPDPAQRRFFVRLLTALVVVAVLTAVLAVVLNSLAATARHRVVAPLGTTTAASIDVVSGVTAVTVRSADLGHDLYRISTPTGTGQVPAVSTSSTPAQDPAFAVSLRSTSGPAPGQVDILLSSHVTWQVRVTGGATTAKLDLRSSPLSGVELASGISSADVWLPEPGGTVAVAETGGANHLALHAPVRVPVKVTVDGGAGTVTLDGEAHTGVSAGTSYAPNGWDMVTDRYDVRLTGGVSTVDLDRFAG